MILDVKNAVTWFEIPAADFARAKKFYETVFNIEMPAQNMMGYDMAFFAADKGGVSGSIIAGEVCVPSPTGTMVYLNGGPDLNEPLGRVEAAGGKILQPKTLITPEVGYMAVFLDSENNRVALHSLN